MMQFQDRLFNNLGRKRGVQFLNKKLDQLICISYFDFEFYTEPFVAFKSVQQCGQHAVTQMAEPSQFSWFYYNLNLNQACRNDS